MIERFEKLYSIEEVFAFVTEHADKRDRKKKVIFDGHKMKPNSVRYETFIKKGCDCIACGAVGKFFAKERHQSHKTHLYNPDAPYHFNLYAIDANGDEVLMTKDHIIPHCDGGSDCVENMAPMCSTCNLEKGATPPLKWQEEHPDAEQLPTGVKKHSGKILIKKKTAMKAKAKRKRKRKRKRNKEK